jgi:ribosomal protein S18 acetylase RimI-like enzyme
VELRSFAAGDAAVVAAWAGPAEAVMWCGHHGGAVPAEKVAGWAAEEGVRAFGLYDAGRLVAYGELWLDDDEAEVELARLIVAPERRRRGVGRALVAELTALALGAYPDVFMRVHPDNAAALRCYLGAGFVPVSADLAAEWNAPQPVRYEWLWYSPAGR